MKIGIALVLSCLPAAVLAKKPELGCQERHGAIEGATSHLESNTGPRHLRLHNAQQLIVRALRAPETCTADLAALYALSARAHSQDNEHSCTRSFETALALAPDLTLAPDADESTRRCYERAKATPLHQRRIVFRMKHAVVDEKQHLLRLSLELDDPMRLASHFAVYFRRPDDEQTEPFLLYRTDRADPSNAFVEVPLLAGGPMEYFVVLADASGGHLARIGSPEKLLRQRGRS